MHRKQRCVVHGVGHDGRSESLTPVQSSTGQPDGQNHREHASWVYQSEQECLQQKAPGAASLVQEALQLAAIKPFLKHRSQEYRGEYLAESRHRPRMKRRPPRLPGPMSDRKECEPEAYRNPQRQPGRAQREDGRPLRLQWHAALWLRPDLKCVANPPEEQPAAHWQDEQVHQRPERQRELSEPLYGPPQSPRMDPLQQKEYGDARSGGGYRCFDSHASDPDRRPHRNGRGQGFGRQAREKRLNCGPPGSTCTVVRHRPHRNGGLRLAPAAILCLLLAVSALGAERRQSASPLLSGLDFRSDALRALRAEIAVNLQSSARSEGLTYPLRFVRYRVKKGEDFFSIMGRVSQNMDTLASLNDIINPNALRTGTVLLIPNARGLFARGKAAAIARHLKIGEHQLVASRGHWFVPGHRFSNAERDYFLGRGFLPPIDGRITSGFGMRRDPFTQQAVFHGGLDIGAPTGTSVRASRGGRVVFAGNAGGYGRLVILEHRFGYRTYYGHLSNIAVTRGSRVRSGQRIGRVGATGRATGPHLHFEVRKNGMRRAPKFVHALQARR